MTSSLDKTPDSACYANSSDILKPSCAFAMIAACSAWVSELLLLRLLRERLLIS